MPYSMENYALNPQKGAEKFQKPRETGSLSARRLRAKNLRLVFSRFEPTCGK